MNPKSQLNTTTKKLTCINTLLKKLPLGAIIPKFGVIA